MALVFQQLQGIGRARGLQGTLAARQSRLRGVRWMPLLLAWHLVAAAQGITLAGRMGDRALLVIDGQAQTVGIGQSTAAGVKLVRWAGDSAEIERNGVRQMLHTCSPAQMGAAAARQGGREVVLTAGPGGHFVSEGAINGKSVRFMVDTGATTVAMSSDVAARIGLSLSGARVGYVQTANGAVPVQMVVLDRVRLGDVELTNISAVVVPTPMPMVLLGNSFLSRVQMQRENDVMRLQLR